MINSNQILIMVFNFYIMIAPATLTFNESIRFEGKPGLSKYLLFSINMQKSLKLSNSYLIPRFSEPNINNILSFFL
jgi:hypothetical protein